MRPLLLLVLLHSLLLSATPLRSLDGQDSELADSLREPATLLLSVRSQTDLPEAQRLLTLASAQEQQTIVLVVLPESALESLAIRRAADRYFKSDFSRPLTYFIKAADHPYPEYKTLLLSPVEPIPLYASETFPSALPATAQKPQQR